MRGGDTRFGRRLAGRTGIGELMHDLGTANQGGEVVMMGGGNPAHVPAAEAVWRRRWEEIAAEGGALEHLLGDYDTPQGKGRFLEAVAAFFRREAGWDIGPDHVAVTAGSQTAYFLLFNLLAGELADGGTRRICFPLVPEYIGYADQLLDPGGYLAFRPRIELRGEGRFKYHIDHDALVLPDDVAAVCLSRPTNPSANVVTDDELGRLSARCRKAGVLLMVDNAYGMPFPGAIHVPASLPRWEPHHVFTFSLSKLGLPGTRTGIVVAAPDIVERLVAMNAVVGLANGTIGQGIVAPLMEDGSLATLRDEVRAFYRDARDRTVALLDEHVTPIDGVRLHEPEGAFFCWLWCDGLPVDDGELYERLKARGLVVVPGHHFFTGGPAGWPHAHQCLRLSYCRPADEVARGVALLGEELRRAYGEGG